MNARLARKSLNLILIKPKNGSLFSIKMYKELRIINGIQSSRHNVVMASLGISTLPEIQPDTYKLATLIRYPMYSFILGNIPRRLHRIEVTYLAGMEKIPTEDLKDSKTRNMILDQIIKLSTEYPDCPTCEQNPRNLLFDCADCNGYKLSFYELLMTNLFEDISER